MEFLKKLFSDAPLMFWILGIIVCVQGMVSSEPLHFIEGVLWLILAVLIRIDLRQERSENKP